MFLPVRAWFHRSAFVLLAVLAGCAQNGADSEPNEDCTDPHSECFDPCAAPPTVEERCACGILTDDADGDSVPDCIDLCPQDPGKADPGACGCGEADTDTDTDGTSDCSEDCPDDPLKQSPGQCGCGASDADADEDGVADCVDICPFGDDNVDTEGNGVPDACDDIVCYDDSACGVPGGCGIGQCVVGTCEVDWQPSCDWPAETGLDAVNLTSVGGSILDNEFYSDLSGAVFNPVSRTLWICRNNGPSALFALVEDGAGGFVIGSRNGTDAHWEDFGDLEAVTQVDFADTDTVFLLIEGRGAIQQWDVSDFAHPAMVHEWLVAPHMVSGSGAEGLTFVPDGFLAAHGFVDASDTAYTSLNGMGGVMLVGHQNGGHVYAFDLDPASSSFSFVGKFETAADETAGLELDRSTGQLYVWHDDNHDELEVVRLSSTAGAVDRRLETITVFSQFGWPLLVSENHEGIALAPIEDCVDGGRRFFLTTDGGNNWALVMFEEFPCF